MSTKTLNESELKLGGEGCQTGPRKTGFLREVENGFEFVPITGFSGTTQIIQVQQEVVPTERLKTKEVKAKNIGGFGVIENRGNLDELKVLFDSKCFDLHEGDSVFVRQNNFNAPWANQIYLIEGKEFILIPRDAVVAVKKHV